MSKQYEMRFGTVRPETVRGGVSGVIWWWECLYVSDDSGRGVRGQMTVGWMSWVR